MINIDHICLPFCGIWTLMFYKIDVSTWISASGIATMVFPIILSSKIMLSIKMSCVMNIDHICSLLFLWYANSHASRNIMFLLNIPGIATMVLPIILSWRTVVSNHVVVETRNLGWYLKYKFKIVHVKISGMVPAVERSSNLLFDENVRWVRKQWELLCVCVWCAWASSRCSSFIVGTNTCDHFHHGLHHLYLQKDGFNSNVRVWWTLILFVLSFCDVNFNVSQNCCSPMNLGLLDCTMVFPTILPSIIMVSNENFVCDEHWSYLSC